MTRAITSGHQPAPSCSRVLARPTLTSPTPWPDSLLLLCGAPPTVVFTVLVDIVVGNADLDLRIERQADPERGVGLELVALDLLLADEGVAVHGDEGRHVELAARVGEARLDLGLPERQQQHAFLDQGPLERTIDRFLVDLELARRLSRRSLTLGRRRRRSLLGRAGGAASSSGLTSGCACAI